MVVTGSSLLARIRNDKYDIDTLQHKRQTVRGSAMTRLKLQKYTCTRAAITAALTISLWGCNTKKQEVQTTTAMAPTQQKDTVKYTEIRKNCPIGEFSHAWLAGQLQLGSNLDSLIGCETKLSFELRNQTSDGDIVILSDRRSGAPLVIVKGDSSTRNQISGRVYLNTPAIYTGVNSYSLPNGTSYSVATFQFTWSVKNPKYVGIEELHLPTFEGKVADSVINIPYIKSKMQFIIAPSGGMHSISSGHSMYSSFIERISESHPCTKSNEHLVCEGNAPHGIGEDEAILAIDIKSGDIVAAMTIGGKDARWFGCSVSDMPSSIHSWLTERGADLKNK
jgi:hypothetical protein